MNRAVAASKLLDQAEQLQREAREVLEDPDATHAAKWLAQMNRKKASRLEAEARRVQGVVPRAELYEELRAEDDDADVEEVPDEEYWNGIVYPGYLGVPGKFWKGGNPGPWT